MRHQEPLRMGKRDCQVASAKARRGAGDDGVGRAVGLQLAQHLTLDVKVLKDGLDDKVGLRNRVCQIGCQRNACRCSRRPVLVHKAVIETSCQVRLDTWLGLFQNLLIPVGQGNL